MPRLVRLAAWICAAALLATPARSASAQTFFQWTGCGGTVFNTCVDVTISKVNITLVPADGPKTLIEMIVKNTGSLGPNSYSSVFTALGVKNIPYRLTSLAKVLGAGSGWTFSTGITELKNFGVGFEGVNINGNTGIASGQQATFYFTFLPVDYTPVHTCTTRKGKTTCVTTYPGAPTGWQAGRPMEFALHGQVGPKDCSTKLDVQSLTGESYSATTVDTPTGTTIGCEGSTTVTPEPATILLAATGLAGLLVVVRRRREFLA
ncbi:MAG: PEP-CTERM sorting domain-containing protein [Gemmatimonadetes bacterium]|nr:PEP-CTERM sorting domain-containing protein [Gemmatimonadota bacterium]